MGPLSGIRVLDIGGVGPGPWGSTMLADMGAEVLRIERPGETDKLIPRQWRRGLTELTLDLKEPSNVDYLLKVAGCCDVLVEGFRPGIAERLGLGPDVCQSRNARLIYCRITGWGQHGPYAGKAGHDINYLAVSGILDSLGRRGDPPYAPLYFLGDWAAGAMLVALGVTAALVERARSGQGQVIDAAMVDGAALMSCELQFRLQYGGWLPERGRNIIDSGSWYDTYQTADAQFMAVGALEHQFFTRLLHTLGLDQDTQADRQDSRKWQQLKEQIASAFAERTQEEWCEIFDEVDACVSPVRPLAQAHLDPHLQARKTFIDVDGERQPAPAPRFVRTPCEIREPATVDVLLRSWGLKDATPGRRPA